MGYATILKPELLHRTSDDDSLSSSLLQALGELKRQSISFCYWKSTRRLQSVVAGEGDVDLLVARRDHHRVHLVLNQVEFKQFPSVGNREGPSIATYLGFDESSGRLIHLHLHFRLIVGEKLFSNYRLPWENDLLARATTYPNSPIPSLDAETEAVMLMVRASLELRALDPLTLRNWRETAQAFECDRKRLASTIDHDEFRRIASRLMNAELADRLLESLLDQRPLRRQSGVRKSVRRHCSPYRIYGGPEARARAAARFLALIAGWINKRFVVAPRPWNRGAPGGGIVISILGVDGSGKSTAVSTLRSWLGSKVDVMPVYFGTGDGRPSVLLAPFKWILPLVMRLRGPKCSAGDANGQGAPGAARRFMMIVWAVAVAIDKRQKLLAARRGAGRGMVVITDRYPQCEIKDFNDGPLLRRFGVGPTWLQRLEEGVYTLARQLPPDLVLKLNLSEQTAKKREPSMDPAVIQVRIAALGRLEFPSSSVVQIDAEQPLDDVVCALKREVWKTI